MAQARGQANTSIQRADLEAQQRQTDELYSRMAADAEQNSARKAALLSIPKAGIEATMETLGFNKKVDEKPLTDEEREEHFSAADKQTKGALMGLGFSEQEAEDIMKNGQKRSVPAAK